MTWHPTRHCPSTTRQVPSRGRGWTWQTIRMSLIDLSHVIEHGTVTYPGLPALAIDEYLSFEDSTGHYAPVTEFSIGRITMIANTGTHLGSPP